MLELKRKFLGFAFCLPKDDGDTGDGAGAGAGAGNSAGAGSGASPGKQGGEKEGNGGDGKKGGGDGNDGDKSDAKSDTDTNTETNADPDPDTTQQRAVTQMARQGLVADLDQTGAIVGAKPETIDSFGLFGKNSLGSGVLRARTPSEIKGYGIDLDSLTPADRIGVISPSRTIASDVQRAATTGLTALGGPVGSVVGMGFGHSIDSAITNSRLKDLGFSDTQARAIADSAIGARTAGRAFGMIGSAAVGPVAGAIAGLSDNPLGQLAIDAATKKAASYGLSLAGQSFADRYGNQVYGDIMAGRAPASPQGNTLGSDGDHYAVAANAPGMQGNIASAQPAADIDIGSDFYDYVSKFGGSSYG